MAGCSSAPEVEGADTDALISGCLDSAEPIAHESNAVIEGTVSSVTTTEYENGTEVHVVFDARESDGTTEPASCTMVVSEEEVMENKLGPPESDTGTSVGDAVERWNEQYAEDWLEGNAPTPANVPYPTFPDESY